MKLRDRFWLWGHPEGRYNNNYEDFGNFEDSRMTPMECCLYLGINKTFMVPVGVDVNRRQYNKSFKTLSNVGWECFGADKKPEKVEEILRESREFPNITAAVFDDFYGQAKKRAESGEVVDAEALWKIRERLNRNEVRPIDMWMVLYTREFGIDEKEDEAFRKYLEPFNGIIMWTWHESWVPRIPEKFEIFKRLTPNQRRMFGCYLYNFGEKKKATSDAVRWQLDFYREKLFAGEAEGIVLHTNTMADLDHPAYDTAIEWMERHGDEDIE